VGQRLRRLPVLERRKLFHDELTLHQLADVLGRILALLRRLLPQSRLQMARQINLNRHGRRSFRRIIARNSLSRVALPWQSGKVLLAPCPVRDVALAGGPLASSRESRLACRDLPTTRDARRATRRGTWQARHGT